MPRGDRTGPMGMGPMTGRRAGYCSGYAAPGFANPGPRMGFGRGMGWGGGGRGYNPGFGRGWRHRFYAAGGPGWAGYDYGPFGPVAPTMSREQETSWLKGRAADLQEALRQINERLSDLEQE